jgi:23S rRNA pseudouridine2457 synthase
MPRYFIIHKAYAILSQFSDEDNRKGLASVFNFPKDVYPVGRLDADSEGLLLISNDKSLNFALLNPDFEHKRSYYVQVEGQINKSAINKLQEGVEIQVDKTNYITKKCEVKKIGAPKIAERSPAPSYNKKLGYSWIKITLTEGKNRQIRKMSASVGFPAIRLIRFAIENLQLGQLKAGEFMEMQKTELFQKLNIKPEKP